MEENKTVRILVVISFITFMVLLSVLITKLYITYRDDRLYCLHWQPGITRWDKETLRCEALIDEQWEPLDGRYIYKGYQSRCHCINSLSPRKR